MRGTRWAVATVAVWALAFAAPAAADHKFTIDRSPDGFGQVVTDPAGNGYVGWEHAGQGDKPDTPMFCKLPPGATRCAHPIALQLPDAQDGSEADASTPFPIIGPGSVVWVVTDRYVLGDTLIWTSYNGGHTFGPAHSIPDGTVCPFPGQSCRQSQPNPDLTSLDDTIPETNVGTTYDRQAYLNGKLPYVGFLQASHNPGLGYAWSTTDTVYDFGQGAFEFTFANPGSGGVAGSTIGTTSTGDVIEAYWLDSTPERLAYYYFTPTKTAPASNLDGPSSWRGPVDVGGGYVPRLAEGAAGTFMLSSDVSDHAGDPLAVHVRRWSTKTHSFGHPVTLVVHPPSSAASYLFIGGGLGENVDTGEVAAVWPAFGSSSDEMQLWLSTDGGKKFSSPEDVASIGSEYGSDNNARVAVANNGTGFVAFVDAGGLEIADLLPSSGEYKSLTSHGRFVWFPATCPAPSGKCTFLVSIHRLHGNHGSLGSERFSVRSGATRLLKIPLSVGGFKLLERGHGQLGVILELTIRDARGLIDKLELRSTLRAAGRR